MIETGALRGEGIERWRTDFLLPKRTDVTEAEIVGHDVDDVGRPGGRGGEDGEREKERQREGEKKGVAHGNGRRAD